MKGDNMKKTNNIVLSYNELCWMEIGVSREIEDIGEVTVTAKNSNMDLTVKSDWFEGEILLKQYQCIEKREDGVFIPNEDIKKVKNIFGYVSLSFLGLEILRLIFKSRNGRKI